MKFIIGRREDLPEKYLDKMLLMIREYNAEKLPFNPPNLEYYRAYWNAPILPEQETITVYAFNESDKLIGYGYSGWNIKYDNLDYGFFQIFVEKNYRRKGYGTKILKKLLTQIPPQITNLSASAKENSSGEYFLRSFKNERSFEETITAANLSKFKLEEIKEIVKEETKRIEDLGFSFIELENFNYKEKFDENEYIKMIEQIWNDMPREELSIGEDVFTAERYEEMIANLINRGNIIFGFAIIEKISNKPVGHSRVFYNKFDLEIVEQDDTGVIPEYRGNGFGLALKYKVLEKILNELKAKYWVTGTAESNKHMIAINKKLKHKKIGKNVVYELKKDEWEKILAKK